MINLHRHAHLRPLVEAILHHECPGLTYSAMVIDRALTLVAVSLFNNTAASIEQACGTPGKGGGEQSMMQRGISS